jgi:hypothetical protein
MPTKFEMKRPNMERYSGSNIPEIFLVDTHKADGIRIVTPKTKEDVLKLVTDISSSEKGSTTIDCIQKYKAGTYELVEMDVIFRAGRLMLVEKV